MKQLTLFLCIIFLGSLYGVTGQTTINSNIATEGNLRTFMNSDMDYLENQRERYAIIEGSAYLDETFHPGSVSFRRIRYPGLKLRHNPYEGNFEIQTEDGIKFFDPRITPLDTVWLDRETFVYVLYKSGNALKRDYMRMMNQGATQVFLFTQVILIPPEPAQGYQEARPARFEQRGDAIFIKNEDQPAVKFKGKKSLEEIFPSHHAALYAYVKKEKLKLKKSGEIISLCAYYDTIR